MTVLALVIALGTAAAIAGAYGVAEFAHVWSRLQWAWLSLAAAAAILAVAAYAISYRAVAAARGGPRLRRAFAFLVVIRGFAPFAAGGGFALDKRVLRAFEQDDRRATLRVLGLGALEWVLLAPAAWISAIVLLVVADKRPMTSLTWPWAIAVPIGFVLGFWLATPSRRERISGKGTRWRSHLAHGLSSVEILRFLARSFSSCWAAWTGMAAYWVLDIGAFYGATRFVGLRLNLGELTLTYATGYALTRRSMPLGGAGVTEALMTFSLHWVGQPVLPALAAVLVYRVFNLALPAIPGLLARPEIRPVLEAAESGVKPPGRPRFLDRRVAHQ